MTKQSSLKDILQNLFGIGDFSPEHDEAKAIGSLYAICIFGIGVFTPELSVSKKLSSLALDFSPERDEAKAIGS